MNGKNLFYISLIIFLIVGSCKLNNDQKDLHSGIQIGLSTDSTSIQLKNVPLPVIETFSADSMSMKQWQSLFAVYQQAADPDLTDLQTPMSGNYEMKGAVISFKPDEGFEKGRSYLVQYYAEKMITSQQEIIQAKKLPYKNKPYSLLITF